MLKQLPKKAHISLDVAQLSSSIVVNGTTVPKGYYEVRVNVSNNPGFSTTGMAFTLNGFSVCSKNNNGVVSGVIKPGLISVISGANGNKLGTASGAAGYEETEDGVLFTFYAKRNTSGPVSVTYSLSLFSNSSREYVADAPQNIDKTGKIDSSTQYRVGDVTNDGRVSAEDATQILTSLDNHRGEDNSVGHIQSNLRAWFPYAKCANAADANQDGLLTKKDSDDVLQYAAYDAIGMKYNDVVGSVRYYFS